MTFGEKIQTLRKDTGLSQEELAERLEVSRQAVSKWERGAGYPETEKLVRMSRLFGVTLDYLLGEDEGEARDTPEQGVYISEAAARGFLSFQKRKNAKTGAAMCAFGLALACIMTDAGIGEILFILLVIAGIILLVSSRLTDDTYREMRTRPVRLDKSLHAKLSAEYAGLSRTAQALSLTGLAMALAGLLLPPFIAPEENYRLDNFLLAAGFALIGAGIFLWVYFSGIIRSYRMLIMNEEYHGKGK